MLENNSSIPLFPLNVVLFPGMLLPLHIFEDRYKTMIRDCLGSSQVFGVVLAKNKRAQAPDVGGVFFDDLYDIGTTAHISAVEHYKDGRMTLITVGQDRFILRDIHPSQNDFLIGRVDPLPMEEDNHHESISRMERAQTGNTGDISNPGTGAAGYELV